MYMKHSIFNLLDTKGERGHLDTSSVLFSSEALNQTFKNYNKMKDFWFLVMVE